MRWEKARAYVHAIDNLAAGLCRIMRCPRCWGKGDVHIPDSNEDLNGPSYGTCDSCGGSGITRFAPDGIMWPDVHPRILLEQGWRFTWQDVRTEGNASAVMMKATMPESARSERATSSIPPTAPSASAAATRTRS